MVSRDQHNQQVEDRRTKWQGVKYDQQEQWGYIVRAESNTVQSVYGSWSRIPSWAFAGCRFCGGKGCIGCDGERERAEKR